MTRSVLIRRVIWSMLIGLLMGVIVSEGSFYLLNDGSTRTPKLVVLDIPPGTAVQVARGQGSTSLPTSMTFVIGDQLQVNNYDVVAHQLGPLFIPPGTSASMNLANEDGYNLLCSFEPSKYLQLTVLPPLTLWTRITGVLEVGLNAGFIIAVYALIAIPVRKKATA